jgi:hypothetical protein
MAVLPGLRVQNNFLFHHTTAGITDPAALAEAVFHDDVLHTASVIALLFLILTALALFSFAHSSSQKSDRATLYTLAVITGIIALLLTPVSNPVWLHAPELAFLQFPWRTLALLAAVVGLSVALALRSIKLKPTTTMIIGLATAAALTFPAYTLFRQACDPEDTVAGRTALFHSKHGTEPTDEYTPNTADNDALAADNPPYWLASNPDGPAPDHSAPGPAPRDLGVNSPIPQTVILNLRDYPAWRVTRDGSPIVQHEPRADGLIAIPIPAGASRITVRYIQLLDQTIGLVLTTVSLVFLSLVVMRGRPKPRAEVLIYHQL